jgi:hypothetical protein
MAIDKSGKWWIGSMAEDLREYLIAFSSEGYKIHDFRLAKCQFGSEDFYLWADDGEGTAKRICLSCESSHLICDSEEYWEDSMPIEWVCVECSSKLANFGVGFSLYEDGEIRWLYIGERCSTCGVLGCAAQWKVAYAPSKQLLDQV